MSRSNANLIMIKVRYQQIYQQPWKNLIDFALIRSNKVFMKNLLEKNPAYFNPSAFSHAGNLEADIYSLKIWYRMDKQTENIFCLLRTNGKPIAGTTFKTILICWLITRWQQSSLLYGAKRVRLLGSPYLRR